MRTMAGMQTVSGNSRVAGKTEDVPYDEEAAIDAAQEQSAVLQLRDALKREDDDSLKGRPRNEALEKWGADIEAEILRNIQGSGD